MGYGSGGRGAGKGGAGKMKTLSKGGGKSKKMGKMKTLFGSRTMSGGGR